MVVPQGQLGNPQALVRMMQHGEPGGVRHSLQRWREDWD